MAADAQAPVLLQVETAKVNPGPAERIAAGHAFAQEPANTSRDYLFMIRGAAGGCTMDLSS